MSIDKTELSQSIKASLVSKKKDILKAMNLAMSATKASFNPFGKKAKLDKLNSLYDKYNSGGDEIHLIYFIIVARQTRGFFATKSSSFKSLETSFASYDFLKNLLTIIFGNKDLNSKEIISSWNKTEPVVEAVMSDSIISNPIVTNNIEDHREEDIVANSVEKILDKSNTVEVPDNSSSKHPKNKATKKPSSAIGSRATGFRQIEDPLKAIDPEQVNSFADMGRKIKLIQQDIVKSMLAERFGDKNVKKKVESQEQQATPEELAQLKKLLIEAGFLEKLQNESLKIVTFTEENQAEENATIEKAAALIFQYNLIDLAYNSELKIAKYQYKRIQTKAKEQISIKEAYDKSQPVDEGFIERCMQHINGLDLSALSYSKYYPFSEEQFKKIMELGLSDAEKINQICGDILYIDTKTLLT